MSWKAEIATIVCLIAAPAAASSQPFATHARAAPAFHDHRGASGATLGPVFHDHRGSRSAPARSQHFYIRPVTEVDGPPTELFPFRNGRTAVALDGVLVRGIELTVSHGVALVQQVTIHYADGRSQTVAVHRQLDGDSPYVDFEVEPRPISALTIDGAGTCLGITTF